MLVSRNEYIMKKGIYLDNAATTRIDERVLEAMLPYFSTHYGNASSLHSYGAIVKETMDNSRQKLASFLNAQRDEIYFTSGGTEANNLAVKGVAIANSSKGNHIIVSAIEHDCILNACKWLETQGFYVSYLPVDHDGLVDLVSLKQLINPKTILVSVMYANNEIGTIEPITEIGKICHEHNVLFHTDACQSFGKIPIDIVKDNIDLLTLNAHKIYGPKGVGALYIRKGVAITPLLHGGGQEGGIRSSTENIPGIIGFVKAAELCIDEMEKESRRQKLLRDRITDFLFEKFDDVYINGHTEQRLPGHLSFSFHGMEGETIRLLLLLDDMGIAVSAGSACSSNDKSNNVSHVLQAIGRNPFEARGAIRISLGRYTSIYEIEELLNSLLITVFQLNSIFS